MFIHVPESGYRLLLPALSSLNSGGFIALVNRDVETGRTGSR